MADQKITDLTANAAPASNDLLASVDVSDTTMAATGTDKKVTHADAITKSHGLSDGIVKVSSGVMTPATAGTDYTTSSSGSAATLTTARTFRTNLASTSTASFDGSANVTPGVTGTLPVGNGGTGATTLTGLVKGNGTSAMTAATAGTDYLSPGGTETVTNKTIDAASNTISNIGNSNFSTTAGDIGGAWTTWTPTLGGITLGNGTATAEYTKIGKTLFWRLYIVAGTTTSMAVGADTSFSLPVAINETVHYSVIGTGSYIHSNTTLYMLSAITNNTSTTSVIINIHYLSGSNVAGKAFDTAQAPSFASGDAVTMTGFYQVA